MHLESIFAEVGRAFSCRLFEIHSYALTWQLARLSHRYVGHLESYRDRRRKTKPAALCVFVCGACVRAACVCALGR